MVENCFSIGFELLKCNFTTAGPPRKMLENVTIASLEKSFRSPCAYLQRLESSTRKTYIVKSISL